MPLVAMLSVSTCLFKTVYCICVLRLYACRRAAAWKPEEGSVVSLVPGSSATLLGRLCQITRPAGLAAFTDTVDALDWSKQLCAHANTHMKSAECPLDSHYFKMEKLFKHSW